MAAEAAFDYYYGDESNQFSLYRIPRQLITGDRFKLLSELGTGNGFGLIERIKQGRPTKIHVKRFSTREKPPQPAAPQDIPRLPKTGRKLY